jgi:hypothetical protein
MFELGRPVVFFSTLAHWMVMAHCATKFGSRHEEGRSRNPIGKLGAGSIVGLTAHVDHTNRLRERSRRDFESWLKEVIEWANLSVALQDTTGLGPELVDEVMQFGDYPSP